MKIVQFPKQGTADIAAGLDNLKEIVEVGLEGEAEIETLVWVSRDKNGKTMIGALGRCPGGLDEAFGLVQRAFIWQVAP